MQTNPPMNVNAPSFPGNGQYVDPTGAKTGGNVNSSFTPPNSTPTYTPPSPTSPVVPASNTVPPGGVITPGDTVGRGMMRH